MLSLVEAEVNPPGCRKARDFAGFLLPRRRNPASGSSRSLRNLLRARQRLDRDSDVLDLLRVDGNGVRESRCRSDRHTGRRHQVELVGAGHALRPRVLRTFASE